ncbi:Eco57I restriction-modification methylase domain-containing protein [Flavobacterium sp. 5]|uniref:Eco57I restriction-modification methylase domain-containing protein n=1 Tax=Flavobacterium sp. 5 TaxID=2035199 RepID=UPI000CC4B682|nr:Eco57I restriction-modification methylase domain-containing protein [Flavobacterium sp. 5]PKB15115.1 adenine-specific DNA-methyltransferase [Flavobacterium sp. 5]
MDKKKSGSYYTPTRLADFVANYCLSKIKRKTISVLEPSVGDGSFVKAISKSENLNYFTKVNLTIVEKDELELAKAKIIDKNIKLKISSHNSDYLDFHFEHNEEYSLIIGNPPYVKKNLLDDNQKELAKTIHCESELSNRSINNIWTSFLISGISKLKKDGVLAFILPLELLQVKFTEEIRTLLKKEFERIEVFTFNELQFQECKGQDTVLFIGYKKHIQKGTFYTNIASLEDLENNNYEFYENQSLSDSDKKWTHHFITPDEYEFLENLKSRLNNVSYYLNNKAGIVTAANSYFIVNKDTISNYDLEKFSKPIVQKGFFVNGSITFTNNDFKKLVDDNKPAYLLDFNNLTEKKITKKIAEYLAVGVDEKLPLRFKCKQRNKWYQIPNIATVPEAFFFKRSHEYPKMIKNEADILVTDSAYKVEMKTEYNLDNFIFSFYNSLTLTFAELEGRYYGGGVLELTPNEFRVLPIPYTICNNFEAYKNEFKNKSSIQDVLNNNNYEILNRTLGLTRDEIERIELIRQKLVDKRHRK